jgi:flagellar biosynthesis protein FlhG
MPKYDLGGVIAGRLTLAQTVTRYEDGEFDVVAGRSGSGGLANIATSRLQMLADDLIGLAASYDKVIIDLAAGVERTVRHLAHNAATCLVLVTDEPTSLTDAYAFIKMIHAENPGADLRVVANMANSTKEGERTYATLLKACQGFLKIAPPLLGIVRRDPKVREAIKAQSSILLRFPNAEAAGDVETIARKLLS